MRFAKAIKQGKLSSNEVGTPRRLHIKHLNSLDKTIQTSTFQPQAMPWYPWRSFQTQIHLEDARFMVYEDEER